MQTEGEQLLAIIGCGIILLGVCGLLWYVLLKYLN